MEILLESDSAAPSPPLPSSLNVSTSVSANDNETRSDDFIKHLAVYQAALKGDWNTARDLFPDITELCTTAISSNKETALHIAVSGGEASIEFVKNMVTGSTTPLEDLACIDCNGNTALHTAAVVGNTDAATALVDKRPELLYTINSLRRSPLEQAAISCQKETLQHLMELDMMIDPNVVKEHNPFEGQLGVSLLIATIASEFLDVALDLVKKHPNMAVQSISSTTGDRDSALYSLKKKDSALSTIADEMHTLFPTSADLKEMKNKTSRNLLSNKKNAALDLVKYLCQTIVSHPGNEAATIFRRSIMNAAKNGNSEVMEVIILHYPEIVYYVDDETGRNVFHLAASNRFANVIKLLYNMNDRKYMFFDLADAKGNNLMHMCGYLAPPDRLNHVKGPFLQMQLELQWFNEMKKFVHPAGRICPNSDGKTPQMLFTEEHEKLKAKGERWMNDKANAFVIAAALISTVMFAAVFKVFDGLQSDDQATIYFYTSLIALSLLASISSLLMFLSIVTSRYAEEDFLYILPNRLRIGLRILSLSIYFMMLAFSATLYVIFIGTRVTLQFMLVTPMAYLLGSFFLISQMPLINDMRKLTNPQDKKQRLFSKLF